MQMGQSQYTNSPRMVASCHHCSREEHCDSLRRVQRSPPHRPLFISISNPMTFQLAFSTPIHRMPPPRTSHFSSLSFYLSDFVRRAVEGMRQSTMNRSPPFWSHAGAGGDDDTMAVRQPPSVIAASEMDFFSEFFGPLSPASGAHCAPHPVLAARVSVGVGVSDAAESSEDVEKESSSGMKSTPAVAIDTPGCPSEEVDARSKPLRKRKRNRTSEMHNLTERRRRDRIKEKLKALQELIPNSHNLDRASLLDEAIGYIKSLRQQLQIMSGGGIYPAPFVSRPAMPCPRMPHFSPFPGARLNLGIGMGVPGMASSTGLSPPSSSFPATSLVPMAAVSPISHFQSPMAMHYWPYNASQERPTLATSTAVCSQALQAELFHSINQAEPSSAEVKRATQALPPGSLSRVV